MDTTQIEKIGSLTRYFSLVAVIASILGSILMHIIGAIKVFSAYKSYFIASVSTLDVPTSKANISITYLIQAIDAFLIAVTLMIFASGIYSLFVRRVPEEEDNRARFFKISSIAELKRMLTELVIIILMVKFLEESLQNVGSYSWDLLVVPVGVLLLAAAVRVLKLK